LIVVDYLQLMRGTGKEDNREQVISGLSQGLKALAKEAEVPIIALSQLNRSVETRSTKDKRPQLSDLRECIAGDQEIVDARTGESVTLKSVAEDNRETWVHGLDVYTNDVRVARIEDAWSTGVNPVFALRTNSGRTVRATANHPFYTREGWRRLDELSKASSIAVQRIAAGKPEVWFDGIESIIPDGDAETFDVSVPGLHNFVVNGVFAHNSGAIEQDADVIIFVYRDEYYTKEKSTRPGIAELIIAKQRNGPTGTVYTSFQGSCTRFDNLDHNRYLELLTEDSE